MDLKKFKIQAPLFFTTFLLLFSSIDCEAQWELVHLDQSICYELNNQNVKGLSFEDHKRENGKTMVHLDSFSNYVEEEDYYPFSYPGILRLFHITGNSDFGNHIITDSISTRFYFLSDSNKEIIADSFVFLFSYPLNTEWKIFENDSVLITGYFNSYSKFKTYFGTDSIKNLKTKVFNKRTEVTQNTNILLSKNHGVVSIPMLSKLRKDSIISLTIRPYRHLSSYEFFNTLPGTTIESYEVAQNQSKFEHEILKLEYYDSSGTVYYNKKTRRSKSEWMNTTILENSQKNALKYSNNKSKIDTFNTIPGKLEGRMKVRFLCDSIYIIEKTIEPVPLTKLNEDTLVIFDIGSQNHYIDFTYIENIGMTFYHSYYDGGPSVRTRYEKAYIIIPKCDTLGEPFLSVKDMQALNSNHLKIHPNPSHGTVTINVEHNKSQILIYNLLGKLVHSETMMEKGEVSLDLSRLQNGIYIIQVISGNQIGTAKLILER